MVKSLKDAPMTPEEREMIEKRSGTAEGTRPTAAPIPPHGHYWVREMQLQHVGWFNRAGEPATSENTPNQEMWGYYSWDEATLSEWFIVRISDMGVERIASDEDVNWNSYFHVITHVSARIDPPEGE